MKRSLLAVAAALLVGAAPLARAAASPAEVEQMYLRAVELMTEGRHAEAAKTFEELIAREPQHAGAWLELAISHCALGHAAEAERFFREIEVRFAPSPGILEVIDSHRRTGCKSWTPRSYRAMSLTVGTDDNVNQGASNPVFVTGSGPTRKEGMLTEDFLPKRDTFTQAAFEYSRELNQSRGTAFAQFRLRRHHDVSELDTNALLVGFNQPVQIDKLPSHAMVSMSAITLDGALYQRQYQLQWRSNPAIPLPADTELTLAASLGRVAYVTRSSFDSDTGELSAVLTYRGARTHAQWASGILSEHGERDRLGGNRHGWYASVQLQRALNSRTGLELGATRQDWDSARIYATGFIDVVRSQSTRQARLALVRAVAPKHSVVLEYRHVYNKENISLFQYTSKALQLHWRWSGF